MTADGVGLVRRAFQDTPAEWEQSIRLPRLELALLTRQLAVMLGAGLSLHRALGVLCDSAVDESNAVVLYRIIRGVDAGKKLSAAMSTFPRVFGTVFLAMVEVGEETGQLVRTLTNLADWLESEESLIRQIRSAFTYPSIVFCAAAILTVGFLVAIFPAFSDALQSVDDLPVLTLILIAISSALRNPLFWMVGFVGLLGGIHFASRALRAPKNRLAVWKFLTELPMVNQILRDCSASRFASAMTILLQTGVDILKSFHLASLASGSPLIIDQLEEGVVFLSRGGDLAAFMKEHPDAYPSMMAGLVMVGQESATLPEVFQKLQRSLNEYTGYRLDILTSLLEPFLIIFVAALMILLLAGVAMPLYDLVSTAL